MNTKNDTPAAGRNGRALIVLAGEQPSESNPELGVAPVTAIDCTHWVAEPLLIGSDVPHWTQSNETTAQIDNTNVRIHYTN